MGTVRNGVVAIALSAALVGAGVLEARAQDSESGLGDREQPVAAGAIDDGQSLLPQAGITVDEAIHVAQGAASGPLGEVDLEDDHGTLIFNVDIGRHDVKVDAGTGKVLAVDVDD